MQPILVTGAAGFIGFHTCRRLLDRGETIIGLDNLSSYYDVSLKKARLAQLERSSRFKLAVVDLSDRPGVAGVFEEHKPNRVVHLAAQAGVRHSIEHPHVYIDSNVVGFLHILEGCRAKQIEHLVFASTSSAFGANASLPLSIHQGTAHALTLYAATKLANETMSHAYANLFGFPCTGLRFFTVYGPWGRPDMALFKFTKAILEGKPIDVYGRGQMQRDFTYIDDIVSGVVAALDNPATVDVRWDASQPDPATSGVAPWRLLNLGRGSRVELMRYIEVLEKKLGRKAQINFMPMQPGDIPTTEADISDTRTAIGYEPTTDVEVGVSNFIDWYLEYYGISQ